MRVEEQIYTSAGELLEGGSGLGIVAQTRTFPAEIVGELQALNGYTMLADLPLEEPERHPTRHVVAARGPGRKWFTVSQVVYAGADHTGRTTPLAHHIAIERSALKAAGLTPADVLAGIGEIFVRRWEGGARWLENRELYVRSSGRAALSKEGLIAGADGVMQSDLTRRTAVLVIERGGGLGWIAGIYGLLPASAQWGCVAASHVVEPGDCPREAALAVSYCGTAFVEEALRRKDARAPVVIDIVRPARVESPYATILRENMGADGARPVALEEWDALGLGAEHSEGFLSALRLRGLMRGAVRADVVAERLGEMDVEAPWFGVIREAAGEMVERLKKDDGVMAAVASDVRWPEETRRAAAESICARAKSAVPILLKSLDGEVSPVVRDVLLERAKNDPAIGEAALECGGRNGLARQLVAASRPGVELGIAWGRRVMGRSGLKDDVVEALARSLSAGDLDRFCAQSDRAIVLPLLRRRIELSDGADLALLCERLVSTGLAGEEIRWLAPRKKQQITREMTDRWVELARSAGREGEAREALAATGLAREEGRRGPPVIGPLVLLDADGNPVRRAWRIGPIYTPAVLAIAAILLGFVRAVTRWWAGGKRWGEFPLDVAIAFVPVGLWWLMEWAVRRWMARPQRHRVARIIRWSATAVLAGVVVWWGWRSGKALIESFHREPPAARGMR